MAMATKEMIEVMVHYANGGEVESCVPGRTRWVPFAEPKWNWEECSYRIKYDTPSDGVPWEAIDPKWKWAAKDDDGSVWLYENKPKVYRDDTYGWSGLGEIIEVSETLLTYIGDDPKDSLRKRPD